MRLDLSTGKVSDVPVNTDYKMKINSGDPFFHPVTHQLVPTGGFYDGVAHLEHENEAPGDQADPASEEKVNTTKNTSKAGKDSGK